MIRTNMAPALALAVTLSVATAHAAARDRVFVASYGSDSNPCTFGSPCKTFQHAHDVVATSGEITAIDSAGFGPIVINKGVTITSPNGVEAGVVATAGGTAITISATEGDAVVLRGLTLAGSNSANYGIVANAAGKIEIVDSVIRDFLQVGINIELSANFTTLIHISNTKVMNNANTGLLIDAAASGARAEANLDHLTAIDNNSFGISIGTNVHAMILDSNVSNNGVFFAGGCNLKTSGTDSTHSADLVLQNVTLTPMDNSNFACSILENANSYVLASHVFGSGWTADLNSSAVSDGTNYIGLPANWSLTTRD
jgi:hypothetical protein